VADDMGEKTEDATPRRLSEARNRGQVPKSQDLTGAVGLLTALGLFAFLGGGLLEDFAIFMRRVLASELQGGPVNPGELGTAFRDAMLNVGLMTAPFLALAFLIAYAVQFVQVGPLLTAYPIKPKPEKLNPVAGAKRLLSTRNAVKAGVNILKLIAAIGVAWAILSIRMPTVSALATLSPAQGMLVMGQVALELSIALVVLLLVIGFIDLFYQRFQHKKDLKMTKHEVKDERRSMEGDPQVKRRRFEVYREMVSQQVNAGTPQADVIVTNPTHFSVGIAYDAESMGAPKVVVKGADLLAWRIRQIAAQHDIPVVERPPLARALYYGSSVGSEVSPEHYEAIAEVLAYVYRIDADAARRGGAAEDNAPVEQEPVAS
jgi:flagellar biosynthetic protein FlhB